MRKLLVPGALAVAAAIAPQPAAAYPEGPWCAVVNRGYDSLAELCSMRSYEMCRAEARLWGPTAFCRENPRFIGYWGPPDEPRRKRAKSKLRQ